MLRFFFAVISSVTWSFVIGWWRIREVRSVSNHSRFSNFFWNQLVFGPIPHDSYLKDEVRGPQGRDVGLFGSLVVTDTRINFLHEIGVERVVI